MAAAWTRPICALAIERHATSKLPERNGEDDLSHIETLGFRGEALPSIGAVARLSIASRTATGEAHEIKVDGGAVSGPGAGRLSRAAASMARGWKCASCFTPPRRG